MKTLIILFLAACAITVFVEAPLKAQSQSWFFRYVSTTNSAIMAFSQSGTIVWSNAAVGCTGRFQRATTLAGSGDWADYVTCYGTAAVMALRLFDANSPSGMALIPAGSNSGGNPLAAGETYIPGWYPQTYSLTVRAFYMDRNDVTKGQWDGVYTWAITHGYSFENAGSGVAASHPVQTVNWYDCVKWCNARSEKEGRTPAYYTDSSTNTVYKTGQIDIEDNCVNWSSGYRLPTDVEWEYAARGGLSGKRFPWGDTIDHNKANYYGNPTGYSYDLGYEGWDTRYSSGGSPPYTNPGGAFEAGKNGYGLYDMAGNEWQSCWSWYPGYEGSFRMLCGGHCSEYADNCRVASRGITSPDDARSYIGFRAVLPSGQ